MRRRLQFFFMNPIEKWQAKKRFPYKFAVQLVKIILVTTQLCLFASSRYNHVNYTWDNRITFSHLFLKGWDVTREINSYPPAVGPLAIYKIDDFYKTIDYACDGYSRLDQAVGPYSYDSEDGSMTHIIFCTDQYKRGEIFGFNESYIFDPSIERSCVYFTAHDVNVMKSKDYFSDKAKFSFSSLVRATLSFSLKTVNLKAAGRLSVPNCYRFDISIIFDKEDHDGQMLLSLDAEPIRLTCKGDVHYITDDEISAFLRSLLNYTVIVTCLVSFVLCTRAIWRAQQLKSVTNRFFTWWEYNGVLLRIGALSQLDCLALLLTSGAGQSQWRLVTQ